MCRCVQDSITPQGRWYSLLDSARRVFLLVLGRERSLVNLNELSEAGTSSKRISDCGGVRGKSIRSDLDYVRCPIDGIENFLYEDHGVGFSASAEMASEK